MTIYICFYIYKDLCVCVSLDLQDAKEWKIYKSKVSILMKILR